MPSSLWDAEEVHERYRQRVDEAFLKSDMLRTQQARGEEWAYSICAGEFRPHAPVCLVGLNWGTGSEKRFTPMAKPDRVPLNPKELGSLRRIGKYLGDCFRTDLGQCIQTNLCFFRSPFAADITAADYEACWPIFRDLLAELRPGRVLLLAASAGDLLKNRGVLSDWETQTEPFRRGGRELSITTGRGWLNINGLQLEAATVPHPNQPLPGQARAVCWSFAAGRGTSRG